MKSLLTNKIFNTIANIQLFVLILLKGVNVIENPDDSVYTCRILIMTRNSTEYTILAKKSDDDIMTYIMSCLEAKQNITIKNKNYVEHTPKKDWCSNCCSPVTIDDCEAKQYWTNNGDRVVFHICPKCGEPIENISL
ncbi:MAG: hypothetical protein ACI37Z_05075 [Candidatus Gastranaerophilaceae bacterium]